VGKSPKKVGRKKFFTNRELQKPKKSGQSPVLKMQKWAENDVLTPYLHRPYTVRTRYFQTIFTVLTQPLHRTYTVFNRYLHNTSNPLQNKKEEC